MKIVVSNLKDSEKTKFSLNPFLTNIFSWVLLNTIKFLSNQPVNILNNLFCFLSSSSFRIDIYFDTKKEAKEFGRKGIWVKIIDNSYELAYLSEGGRLLNK